MASSDGAGPGRDWGRLLTLAMLVGSVLAAVTAVARALRWTDSALAFWVGGFAVAFTGVSGLAKFVRDNELGATAFGVAFASFAALGAALWFADAREDDEQERLLEEAVAARDAADLASGAVTLTGDPILGGRSSPAAVEVDGFSIDKHEVTYAAYARCVAAGACQPPQARSWLDDDSTAEWPVGTVTAVDAFEYCSWLGLALPTELQWLFAARGPGDEPRAWPWGDEPLDDTRAHLAYAPERDPEAPPPASVTGPEAGEDFDEYIDRLIEEAEGAEVDVALPVPVTERSRGQTPEEVTHLLGNVWEWTATSPEVCPLRFDCQAWAPGDERAETLILRGQGFGTVVVVEEADPAALMGEAVPAGVELVRELDVGFRCVGPLSTEAS